MAPTVVHKKEAKVLGTDMAATLQQEIINICFAALEKEKSDNDIAKR